MRAEGSSDASGRTQAQEGIAGLTRTDHAAVNHATASHATASHATASHGATSRTCACANIAPCGAGHSFGRAGSVYRTAPRL